MMVHFIRGLFSNIISAHLPQLVHYEPESVNEEIGAFRARPSRPDAGNISAMAVGNEEKVEDRGILCPVYNFSLGV